MRPELVDTEKTQCLASAQEKPNLMPKILALIIKHPDFQRISVPGLPENVLFLHESEHISAYTALAIRVRAADTSVRINTLGST